MSLAHIEDSTHPRAARPPSRLHALLLLCALLLAGVGVSVLPTPAYAGSCSEQSQSQSDPNTGWSWSSVWYCGNAYGAPIYSDANSAQQVSVMYSTYSWFACFRHGEQHGGGNDVWYYTLGDDPGAWGFMPAVYVYTDVDPWRGVPECGSADAAGGAKGDPVSAINSDGRLEVFTLAADNSVWHAWQTWNGWSEWHSLGGWADRLAVGRNADGRLELIVRGSDGAVFRRSQNTPGSDLWRPWEWLGGSVRDLKVATNLDGRLEVFAIGGDNTLQHMWQTSASGGYSGWASLGGWIDRLTVGMNWDGRLEAFVRGSDRAVHHRSQQWPGGPWYDWGHRGGDVDQISVARNLGGELELFVVGAGHDIVHAWQASPGDGTWSDWESLGGWLDRVAVTQLTDGRLEVFGRGSDGALYHTWQESAAGGWSWWNPLWGGINQPEVAMNADGRLEVFTRGTDNRIWHIWQDCVGCGWSNWVPFDPINPPAPQLSKEFRIVAKSYIAYVGTLIGSVDSCPVLEDAAYLAGYELGGPAGGAAAVEAERISRNTVRLPALGLATDLGFNEDPHDDELHPNDDVTHYRLASLARINVNYQGGKILSVGLAEPLGLDAGQEPGTGCPPVVGCLHPEIEANVDFRATPVSDSLWVFEWAVRGHPAPGAEVGLAAVCPRSTGNIWHSMRGVIDASSGEARISSMTVNGSRFPSLRWWIDGTLQGTIPQVELSALWVVDPTDPSRIQ